MAIKQKGSSLLGSLILIVLAIVIIANTVRRISGSISTRQQYR